MMRPADLQFLAQTFKARSGQFFTEKDTPFLEARLLPFARSQGAQNMEELVQLLKSRSSEPLLVEMAEALVDTDSAFFRDFKVFEAFRKIILPRVMQKQASQQLRIWSAACAAGQEAYSVAICIQEDMPSMPGWRFDILATDFARKAVDKAEMGIYSQFEAQRGLPIQILVKYFTSRPDTTWQVKEDLRSMINFRTHNLLEDYGSLGRFDVILLRNVLGGFDEATRVQVSEKMARILLPHGVLVLGAGETLTDPNQRFAPMAGVAGAYILR